MKEYLKSEQEDNTYCLLERFSDNNSVKGWFILHIETPLKELPADGKIVGTYVIHNDECRVVFINKN
jgi:hypothetical protein